MQRLPHDDTATHTPLPQHVRRALDVMRANVAEKITLPALAAACGVPERTLLKQFRAFVGMPPLAYLRRHRLTLARGRLQQRDDGTAIATIATDCGFTHLGRFAADYRRAFGETPSMTRQRARDTIVATGAPAVWRQRPVLLVYPFRTETLRDQVEARDLIEQLAATLSRMHMTAVSVVSPSRVLPATARREREGGARYALMGRLMRVGERTRVIARLVDIDTDRHLWGDSFDGTAEDPLSLQDRVADGVLCGVVARIIDAELARVRRKDPADRAAHELALLALPLILAARLPRTRDAMTLLERAIALDPCEPLALALSACCHAQLALNFGTASPQQERDEAARLARYAGMLDSDDALVMTARGMALSMSGHCQEGMSLADRALAMDPTSSWAWERHGFIRLCSRDQPDQVIADYRRALQLRDPAWPGIISFLGMASAHRAAGRPAEAELWAGKALAENPDVASTYRWEARYAFDLGDRARMDRAVERMRRLHPAASVSLLLACDPGADQGWLDAMGNVGLPL